ncbi:hypothetical protein ES707_15851 [subsurface metagenome]
MSSKTHDELIEDAVRWAKTLGYEVVEEHPGTDTGADAVFQNKLAEKVIFEVVSGASFKTLFQKPRIQKVFERHGKYWVKPKFLGLIIVGDRTENVTKHGLKAGLPEDVFQPPEQKVFPVLTRDFKEVIPVLLVSLLGARSSYYPRVSH